MGGGKCTLHRRLPLLNLLFPGVLHLSIKELFVVMGSCSLHPQCDPQAHPSPAATVKGHEMVPSSQFKTEL